MVSPAIPEAASAGQEAVPEFEPLSSAISQLEREHFRHALEAAGALGALVDHAIDRLNAARRKVDPTASPIPLIADQPCRELLDHLRPIDAGERRAVLDRAIDVMLATLDARRDPVGEYRMAMLSGEKAWARWRDGTVAGARCRDGPAGRATGRAPPARIDSTDEIDPTTIRPRPRA